MGLVAAEMAIRGAAISLFVLLAIMFARTCRRSLTARLGATLMVGAMSYVALMGIDVYFGFSHLWRLPLHVMSLAAPPLYWLFAASWFDDEFELRAWHWLFVVATVTAGLVANSLFWIWHRPNAVFAFGWRGMSIVAIALALLATVKGWSADLVESRRRVRIALVGAAALAIFWVVIAELLNRGWPPSVEWRIANASSMLVLAGIVALATLGWRDPALIAAPPKLSDAPARAPEADDTQLLARLDREMRDERLYRQDGLTITTVAARLGVPEYRLRRAINHGLGARNFNTYLNSFRIGEAAEALADPEQRSVPILTMALDAGFGSLAPFNRAFRDVHGCTPSEYRARAFPA